MQTKLVLGVDIGGTKVAAGLVNADGEIVFSTRVPMNTSSTAADAMSCVHNAIKAVMQANPAVAFDAIGVSSPGPLDLREGTVLNSPNLPCWRNFALLPEILKTYHIPSRLDNDANAAGLAEALWGAGAGYKSVFYVTIGTGIGTAIILDQHIYYGRTGSAAEGGHMTIDFHAPVGCECGKHGCIESMASGPAIAARARKKLLASSDGAGLLRLAGGEARIITTETVVKAWRAKDALATEVLQETADLFTIWLGNVVDLLEPEVIVIGGGVGAAIKEWFPYIRSQLTKWSINPLANEIPLVPAKYGVDAGIVGSAALWLCEPARYEAASKV
ncbi:MAG TPA: ROK family protein [Terriglobales bacterium]|nr:ROK family protein [Terriglobales bacterium]